MLSCFQLYLFTSIDIVLVKMICILIVKYAGDKIRKETKHHYLSYPIMVDKEFTERL
jgi:hypothetical protein